MSSNKQIVDIVKYSDKCIAVFGETKEYKTNFSTNGGKFNANLTNPKTGNKEAGWIFTLDKLSLLQDIASKINTKEIKPIPVQTPTKDDFVDKKTFMNLVSRVEQLEQEYYKLF